MIPKYLLCLLVLVLSACTAPSVPVATLFGSLQVIAPEAIMAGEPLNLTITHAEAANGLPVLVILDGSAGIRVYRTEFVGGQADVRIPAEETRQAGIVLISARAGAAQGQATLDIRPQLPATPLTPFVGPRGVIADDQDWSIVTIIPQDVFGNLTEEGTLVQVRARNAAGALASQELTTRNGIAWLRIVGGHTAGRIIITAASGDARGPEADLEAVAGAPAAIELRAEPDTLPADGRQQSILRTTVLRDRFGNMLPDGTLVTFLVLTPSGNERRIPAQTIGGVAVAPLQAPTEPGIAIVVAVVGTVRSEPLGMIFTDGPAVGRVDLHTHIDQDQGLVIVRIGPLVGELGQLVPDGTPVQLSLIDAARSTRRWNIVSDRGYATAQFNLAELAPGSVVLVATAGAASGSTSFVVP